MEVAMHQMATAPLRLLRPAGYNPRKITEESMKALQRSLVEYGFVEPVVARAEDGLVVGGHQRIEAFQLILKEKGLGPEEIGNTHVPVVYLEGITDDQAKILNIALNRIQGDWHYDRLRDVISGLDMESVDPTLSGFSMPEIEDLVTLLEQDIEKLNAVAELTLQDSAIDPDAVLAAEARQFTFQVEAEDEAELCQAALRAYGMTGPRNSSEAFVAALRVALAAKEDSNDDDCDSEV